MSATDPFPRERFAGTIRRLPRYGRLAWRVGRDPLLSRGRRAAVIAAAGYLASPIDAVPDFVPVLGRLDDIAVILAALRFAMAGLDPVRRREHLDAVGLRDDDLAEDLRTIGLTTTWTLRAGGRTTVRVVKTSATVGGAAVGAARDAAPVAAKAAGTATRAAGTAIGAATNVASSGVATAKDAAPRARDAAGRGGGKIRAGAAKVPRPSLPRRARDTSADRDKGTGI